MQTYFSRNGPALFWTNLPDMLRYDIIRARVLRHMVFRIWSLFVLTQESSPFRYGRPIARSTRHSGVKTTMGKKMGDKTAKQRSARMRREYRYPVTVVLAVPTVCVY